MAHEATAYEACVSRWLLLRFGFVTAKIHGQWQGTQEVSGPGYDCGHCGTRSGPSRRYIFAPESGHKPGQILICPVCNRPTFVFAQIEEQVPGPLVGRSIKGITDAEVEKLYDEARKALASSAPSAAVMVCRKLLMHIAVEKGAKPNKGFTYYADYLTDEHIVGAPFVDVVKHIKDQGNKENHELEVSTSAEAEMLLRLVEFVLASIYELPGMVPATLPPAEQVEQPTETAAESA